MNRIPSHHTDMEFIDIPGTSIRASRIALGTWAIGGWMWGGSDEAESIRTIHAALDRGINLIDTAPVYGFGRSEEIVGKALADGGRRKRVFIATKVGLDWKDGKPFRNASRARHHRGGRGFAAPAADRRDRPLPGALARPEDADRGNRRGHGGAARAGKDPRHRRQQFLARADGAVPRKSRRCTRVQPPYNLFERAIEHDVLPYCSRTEHRDAGLRLAVPRAAVRGHDGGRRSSAATTCARAIRNSRTRASQQYLDAVERLDQFAQEHYGKRVIHLAAALGARSRRRQYRVVGRAPPRSTRADRRRRGMAHRQACDGGDRPDPAGDDQRSRRS